MAKYREQDGDAVPASSKKPIVGTPVREAVVMTRVPGFELVEAASGKIIGRTPAGQTAAELLPKLARALNRPGIPREAVFKGRTKNVYSYSIDPSDITRVVRVDARGKRSIGRLVGDRFVPIKAA